MSSADFDGVPTCNTRAQELTKLLGREAVKSVLNSKQESLLSGSGRQRGRAHHLELTALIQHETGNEGTEWPKGSGISFTAGLAPRAWADGFRMAAHAEGLMQAMLDELPSRYEGAVEFPMKTVAQAARRALLRVAAGADPADVMSNASWRRIVAGCGRRSWRW